MATFPELIPATRIYTPGEYPNTAVRSWNGIESRTRHSNIFANSTLSVSFVGITETQLLSILSHFQGQRGSFESFDLSAEIWVGVQSPVYFNPVNYRWRYAQPPSVSDIPSGRHNVDVVLVSVPYEGAQLSGLKQIIQTAITFAGVAVSNGLTKTVTISFAPGAGDAPVNANGFTEIITLSVTGGGVQITPAGLASTITLSFAPGAASGGGATDPDFADVGLLLHMNGTNGSTTFTDSSSNAHTITTFGDAQISTAQFKFGGASGVFDGTGDYVRPPASSTLVFGTGDFTMECWVRFSNITGAQAMVAYGTTALRIIKNASHKFVATIGGSSITGTTTVVADTWYHVAMCRASGTVRLFVNGTEEGTALTSNTTNHTLNQPFIGRISDGTLQLNGYLDDVRLTKADRYTTNFTAPTAEFPDS